MVHFGATHHNGDLGMMEFFKKKKQHEDQDHDWPQFGALSTVHGPAEHSVLCLNHLSFSGISKQRFGTDGISGVRQCQSLCNYIMFLDKIGRRRLLIRGDSIMELCLISIGLLSGESTVNVKNPCESELFLRNVIKSLHIGAENVTVETLLAAVRNNGLKPLEHPLESGGQDSLNKWIIFLCMTVVSTYSARFGPSMYLYEYLHWLNWDKDWVWYGYNLATTVILIGFNLWLI